MSLIDRTLMEKYTDEAEERMQLKASVLEKEFNDYKNTLAGINVIQEARQSVTGYNTISLPKNCANGQVSAELKGQTTINLGGRTKTSIDITTTTAIYLQSDGTMSKGTGNLKYVQIKQGEKYYVRVKLKPESQVNVDRLYFGTHAFIQGKNTKDIYGIYTADADKANAYLYTQNAPDQTGTLLVDYVILCNLTSAGMADLTADQVYQQLQYTSGTKSTVGACRIKSVGKNLFDGELTFGDVNTLGAITSSTDRTVPRNPPKVLPDTTYTIKEVGGKSVGRLFVRDRDNKVIGGELLVSNSTFTTPSNVDVDNLIWRTTFSRTDNTFIQLEEGTVATSYEPYTSSSLYLNAGQPLRSLPNGTKDEISDGKLIKRVSDEYILDGNSGFKFLDSSFANTYRMVLDNWIVGKNVLLGTTGSGLGKSADGDYPVRGNTAGTDVRSLVLYTNNYLYVYIEKAKVDAMDGATTEDKFKAYLNQYPITLTYQLAQPEIIPVQSSGSLYGHPSGTVYVEPVLPVAGVYETAGIAVTYPEFPIANIEKISKVDPKTGIETELPVAGAVIATDKLSFTHPGLTAKDIVFFTYYHAAESTIAETTISYYDSRYTIKDSVTGKFYKWQVSVANGTPSLSVVEV